MVVPPLVILAIGIALILGLIVWLRVNAFLALVLAAMAVSLLAPGDVAEKMSRVGAELGKTAGSIGIIIALAAIIGKCMMDSGAADRIVRFFLRILGEKRGDVALVSSGYVLSIPVFFDTVFYLLVPLARSMHRKTGKNYLLYVMAIAAGGACTHTMVPPTPGPLATADALNVDLGLMIMIGALIGVPASMFGVLYAHWLNKRMPIEMKPTPGEALEPEPTPIEDKDLPPLWLSFAPVILPVLLIGANTALTSIADAEHAAQLSAADVNVPALRASIDEQAAGDNAAPTQRLLEHMPADAKAILMNADASTLQSLNEADQATLIAGMNKLLTDRNFYDRKTWRMTDLPKEAEKLGNADRLRQKSMVVEHLNRLLLETTYGEAAIKPHVWETSNRKAANFTSLIGNPNFALMISAGIAIFLYVRQRKPKREEFKRVIEESLMSAGVIILITAAGGAFGAMLRQAGIGGAIQDLFAGDGGKASGMALLFMAFGIASIIKIAQGSSTVAMITTASMISAMIVGIELPFNPVYLATAIASGSLIAAWMNDSGFWIYSKMGGFSEVESLKSWTVMLIIMGLTGMLFTLILSNVLPLM